MTIAFICTLIYYKFFRYRHLKILQASCRKWIQCARRGDLITYRVQILTRKPSKELTLDELWIGGRLYRLQIFNALKRPSSEFCAKEILFLDAERETLLEEHDGQSPKASVSLGYLINNKRKYLPIKTLEEFSSPLSIAGSWRSGI